MKLLEERIQKDGEIRPGDVLKVDSFINHQMDIPFINELGKEFRRLFADVQPDRILTIEASGIGIAAITAQYFDCPMVFAKKSSSINLSGDVLTTTIRSYTHQKDYEVAVEKRFLEEGDKILIIDDFLANGCATRGLIDLVEQAGAEVVGIGIVVEKGYQAGGQYLRDHGYHLESLAIVESMDEETGTITFRH